MNQKAWKLLRECALKICGPVCMNCGRHSSRPQVDHVLPRSEYPHLALDPHNVQILCPPCNRDKGAGVFSHECYGSNELDQDAIRLMFVARLVQEFELRDIALDLIERAQRQRRQRNAKIN